MTLVIQLQGPESIQKEFQIAPVNLIFHNYSAPQSATLRACTAINSTRSVSDGIVDPFSLDLLELFEDPLGIMKDVLFQPILLVDVHEIPDTTLQQHPWLKPAAQAMKHIRQPDITAHLMEILETVIWLANDPEGSAYLELLLNYLLKAGNVIDITEFQKTYSQLPEPARGKFMSIAEQLFNQGKLEGMSIAEQLFDQGKHEGKLEGKLEGKIETALNMLRLGSNIGFVCKATGLTEEQIRDLIFKQ